MSRLIETKRRERERERTSKISAITPETSEEVT